MPAQVTARRRLGRRKKLRYDTVAHASEDEAQHTQCPAEAAKLQLGLRAVQKAVGGARLPVLGDANWRWHGADEGLERLARESWGPMFAAFGYA